MIRKKLLNAINTTKQEMAKKREETENVKTKEHG